MLISRRYHICAISALCPLAPLVTKATDLAEDFDYAKETGMKLNRLWYFEHAVVNSMGDIFAAFKDVDFPALCKSYRDTLDAQRLGVGSALRDLAGSSADVPEEEEDEVRVRVPRPPPPKRGKRK